MTRSDPHTTRGLATSAMAMIVAALWLTTPAHGQMRVVSYNIAKLIGNNASLQDVFEELAADASFGFAVAPGIYCFQEVTDDDPLPLLNMINQAAPPGITYALGTYTNNNENFVGGAQAMIYRTDLLQEIPASHQDIFTGAGRDTDRWKMQLVGYSSAAAQFYIYSSHLKAGSSSDNEDTREVGATTIRNNADNLPADTHIIYCGDWNISSNNEAAYQTFVGTGNGQAFDPLGTGSWGGSGNAIKHTQSPRLDASGGLIGGGIDDRYDFLLSTLAFNDNEGLSLIQGSYRSFGNDGQHYNGSLNTGNNFYFPGELARSNALADDLYTGSDHIPVVADFALPGRVTTTVDVPDRVIELANVQAVVTFTNTANVVVPLGADAASYAMTASGSLVGSCDGTVAPLSAPDTCDLLLLTTSPGPYSATVNTTSSSAGTDVQNPVVAVNGTIVAHANPSFDPAIDLDVFGVTETMTADTGVQPIFIGVFNHGFTSLQALLDGDSTLGLAAPFSLAAPLPTDIGMTAGVMQFQFDTTGLAAGSYPSNVFVNMSDEDLPGEDTYLLLVSFDITIEGPSGCAADTNGDGSVNVDDLVEVILQWGTADPDADINGDGTVNVDDLVAVILDWGCTG